MYNVRYRSGTYSNKLLNVHLYSDTGSVYCVHIYCRQWRSRGEVWTIWAADRIPYVRIGAADLIPVLYKFEFTARQTGR